MERADISVAIFYRACMSERVLRDVTCVINAGRFENTEPARVDTISHRSGCIAHAHTESQFHFNGRVHGSLLWHNVLLQLYRVLIAHMLY